MAAPVTVGDLIEAARRFIAAAREEFSSSSGGSRQGVNHWLRPLVKLWPVVVRLLTPGTDVAALRNRVAAALREGDAGHELTVEKAISAASALVQDRPPGLAELASVALMAAVLLDG